MNRIPVKCIHLDIIDETFICNLVSLKHTRTFTFLAKETHDPLNNTRLQRKEKYKKRQDKTSSMFFSLLDWFVDSNFV